ncbi:MAG: hypothetical protein ACYCYI_08860 [Saccharofermentanales bacterium]
MISRKEAQEILGVTEKSLMSDVDMRYATLVKRYRAEQNNEKLEEISLAYNIITGRYVAPVEDDDIRQQAIFFGKTRKEWNNIWFYGKFKYFAVLIIIIFVAYMIYTIVNNTPADFKISAVGDFYITEESETTKIYTKTLFPEFKKVDVSLAYLNDTAGEMGAANAQRALILLTVSGEDIVIVDKAVFKRYAPMGAFKPIDEFYDTIAAIRMTGPLSLSAVKATVGTDTGGTGTEKIYGIDISHKQLLNAIGIIGREQIITISIKSEREMLAKEFITKLLNDTDNLLPKVTIIPSIQPTPTSKPTITPTPTIIVLPAE